MPLSIDVYDEPTGVWVSLDGDTLCRVLSTDGTGAAPLHTLARRGPMQHGESIYDFRLDPRKIMLSLLLSGATPTELFTKRAALVRLFRVSTSPLQIRWTLPDSSVRQLDCYYAGNLTLPTDAHSVFALKAGITLEAPDPTFYDPVLVVKTWTATRQTASAVPLGVPWAVGAAQINLDPAVLYTGTWRTYPTVVIQGPVTAPRVRNDSTGEQLDFPNLTLSAGQTRVVDCRYGYKTVVDGNGQNCIGDLSADSDLTSFHIASDDEAPSGTNFLRITGRDTTYDTAVWLIYYTRYVGI